MSRAPSFRGHRDAERAQKTTERACAYAYCETYAFQALPGERFCSQYCREHGEDDTESGDGDGDGLFTAAEHATWDANLAALVSRIEGGGGELVWSARVRYEEIGRDVDGDEAAFRAEVR